MKRLLLVCTIFALCCGCEKSTLNETPTIQGWHNDKEMIWDALTKYNWTFERYRDESNPPAVATFFKYPKGIKYAANYEDMYNNGATAIIESDQIDGFYSIDDVISNDPLIHRALFFFKIDETKPILYLYTDGYSGDDSYSLQEEMWTIDTENLPAWFDAHPAYFGGWRYRSEENFFFGSGRRLRCKYMVVAGGDVLYSYQARE